MYQEHIGPMNEQILNFILDDKTATDEEYDQEVQIIDEYTEKILTATLKIEMVFNRDMREIRSNVTEDDFHSTTVCQKKRYKLPKIELKKFSGNIIDWLSWWALFEKIHEDNELSAADKFHYLLQSIDEKSHAYDMVNGFPASADNYPKAIAALKERFGNKKILTQVYIRELFQLGIKNIQEKPVISTIYDKLVGHVRSLESLGITVEQATLFLFPMVEASLPEEALIAWQRSTLYETDGSAQNPPKGKLDFLLEFLNQEVEREYQRSLMRTGFLDEKEKTKKKETSFATAAGLHTQSSTKPICVFCNKQHASQDCYSIQSKSIDEKWEIIKQNKICSKCLKTDHWFRNCPTRSGCEICHRPHHKLLCRQESEIMKSNSGSNNITNTVVILKTILVSVNSQNGPITVRALFDDGSHRSYITTSLAKRVKGKEIGKFFERNTLFGGILSDIEERTIYEVSLGPINKKHVYKMELSDKEKITGEIQKLPDGFWLEELKLLGIVINDCQSDNEEPDILIGADLMNKLTTERNILLKSGLKAVETVFGWTIMGPLPQVNQLCTSLAMSITTRQIDETTEKQLWELETIGIKDPVEVKSMEVRDQEVKECFLKTVSQKSNGRYQVSLPWVNGKQDIPNNYDIALKRLQNSTKKLKQTGMFLTYNQLFEQWEKEDFIERVEIENPMVKTGGHFIPHHAVYKDSKTTPVRPVFDASCKSGRHPSLNECLEKGPNLIEFLSTTIIRFREYRIGILADIRKAFQMIEVHEDDQNYLLFLWWEDDSCKRIVVFKHKRVVFGLKSSPFILAAVIEKHLNSVQPQDRELSTKLKKSLYVDNTVTSVDSWEEYMEFKSKSIELMTNAQMDLRQWEHTWIPEMDKTSDNTEEMISTVLGLKWCKKSDTLSCSSLPTIPEKFTKRTLLATINKIYDPMGTLSPALILPKLLYQSTWKNKLTWDEDLPKELKEQFEKWVAETHYLEQIKIPRCMKGNTYTNESKEQLHIFCDASQLAYAAAVFLRSENTEGISIQLIQSKARVTPIDKVTIQRLELIGSNIGARLGNSVLKALDKNIQCFYWSDSTTVLAWIKRNDEWGTFVGNRVREMLKLTEVSQWNYVPGKINPADLPSRGCSQKQLLESKWWEGPSWLKQPPEYWPKQIYQIDEEKVNAERKKVITENTVLKNVPTIVDTPWFAAKSSFIVNLRIIALLKRFMHNALAKINKVTRKTGFLSIGEINDAEKTMVQLIQRQVFPLNAEIIDGLRVTQDNGIYTVVTKILNRQDTGRFKRPWLLPSNHPVTTQLVIEEHLRYGHAGVQLLVSKLREKFWIIRMKKTVKSIIGKCTVCIRHGKSTASVPYAPLPENRTKDAKVFEISGIDLAGPLYLRDNSKQWVVIFTCAVVRAIHLELVDQINTEQFILALGRFLYRRGRVLVIYTDNGTNFIGTVNLFGKLDWEKIQYKFKAERIVWIFIPPAAPWWGGFWERMVRTMKEYLRKILGHNKLTKVELDTTICFVESLINARPLTYMSEDPDDLEPITPSAFIQEMSSSEYPEIGEITGKKIREKLRHMNQLKEELRSRFRTEYLGQLMEKSKSKIHYQFKVGEMAILQVDDKKRMDWPLVRIIELYPGNDNQIRVARLKTISGDLIRPLNRLIPMELENDEQISMTKITSKKKKKEIPEVVFDDSKEEHTRNKEINTKFTRSGRQIKQPSRLQY
ncbi:uncharacterized protein LOC119082120 [Bradysia coprophila]|uniref:uncharacterized protein LOC119082120 n=1 Tax=Bradysia coprophila TaxID=38358 RepID=UPI00187D8D61|nr:uncharacterized protein LOC119082120 [Bradysia coprophila]